METDGLPVTLKLHAGNWDFMASDLLRASYEQRGIISAPIHMDNVACYGSEERLLDCAHDTDTVGDVHNDIWVKCLSASDVSKSLSKALACMQNLFKLQLTVLMVRYGCQRGRLSGRGDWKCASVGDGAL